MESKMINIIKNKINSNAIKSSFKNEIEWVLNADNYDELCKNAREKVLREFDSKVVAKKYIELYKEVLNA